VIEEEKLQSTPAAEKSEPPKLFTSKPEVVTIIPKAAVEVETPVVWFKPNHNPSSIIALLDIQLVFIYSKQHFFCGDTASPKFRNTPPPVITSG